MQIPTLTGDRFVLRGWRMDDIPALTALHSDPDITRYIRPNGQVETRPAQAWEYISMQTGHWALKGCGKWAMADRETDELIGRVDYDAPYEWPGLELGWTIARRIWGKGYASKAAALALDWGFENLKTDAIISAIHPDNAASIRVADRLGERYVRDFPMNNALFRIYAITRGEWHARRTRT